MKSNIKYKIQVRVINSRAVLVAVTLQCRVKRDIYIALTVTHANSADTDQMLQNTASDQGLHCLLKLQEVKLNETIWSPLRTIFSAYTIGLDNSGYQVNIFLISPQTVVGTH